MHQILLKMKSYRKLFLIVAGFLGIISLPLLVASTNYNACEFAKKNTTFIAERTQEALNAPTLDLVKFHSFRALKATFNSKTNFGDCGCEKALGTINQVEKNLRSVTKSVALDDARLFLEIASKNLDLTKTNLLDYTKEHLSAYGDEFLVMNTKEAVELQGGIAIDSKTQMDSVIEKSLSKFEKSLKDVIILVDCEKAQQFIQATVNRTNVALDDPDLSDAKKYYHKRVLEISNNAIKELSGCENKG